VAILVAQLVVTLEAVALAMVLRSKGGFFMFFTLSGSRERKNQRETLPAEFIPLKIAHVFLNLKNSLRSNSLRF
jgi:hypothetical protein